MKNRILWNWWRHLGLMSLENIFACFLFGCLMMNGVYFNINFKYLLKQQQNNKKMEEYSRIKKKMPSLRKTIWNYLCRLIQKIKTMAHVWISLTILNTDKTQTSSLNHGILKPKTSKEFSKLLTNFACTRMPTHPFICSKAIIYASKWFLTHTNTCSAKGSWVLF